MILTMLIFRIVIFNEKCLPIYFKLFLVKIENRLGLKKQLFLAKKKAKNGI